LGHTSSMPQSWFIRHFSQANPAGEHQASVSALLRRVADTLDEFDDIEVQHLVMETEITSEGPWPSITVYFSLPGDDEHGGSETQK